MHNLMDPSGFRMGMKGDDQGDLLGSMISIAISSCHCLSIFQQWVEGNAEDADKLVCHHVVEYGAL